MSAEGHWSDHITLVKLSRSNDGSFGISVEGGSDKGQFGYVGDIRPESLIVAEGTILQGSVILQVNGEAVGGFIHWDLICEIRRSGSLLTLHTVPPDKGISSDLQKFLCNKYEQGTEDHTLQQLVRQNLYNKTVPCTTRQPRDNEQPGVDYLFISEVEFNAMEQQGVLLERGFHGGFLYGTPRPQSYNPNAPPTSTAHRAQLGNLPQNWEVAYTEEGQKYFINHNDSTTTWMDPRLVALQQHSARSCQSGELPYGWEEVKSAQLGTYYIDHINKRTALQHPGLSGSNGSFNNQTFPPEMLSGYGSPMQGPGHIITITLIKTAKGFGFTLLGGDKVGQPILIKSIKKGSSADQQKMLQPYDVLIRVNSTLVNTLNHSQVVAIFKSLPIGTPTYLELRRPGEEMRPKQRSFETQDSSSSQGSLSQPDLLSVYIEKGSSGFGFTIYQSSSGQRVKQILDRKRCAHFAEGDLIIQINEMFVQSKTHTETVNLLKSIPSHSQTLFVIKRSNDDKSQRRRQKSFRSAMRPTAETFAPPPQTAQRYHNPPQPFHDTNPLSQPRQPLAMQPLKDTNISSDYGSSHGGSERLRYETGSDRYGNAGYASSGNERVVEPGEWEDISIQLQRDNNGFGFRIAGGEEFGTQVTIEHVIPEGPADGYLMVFDELRTINGQSVLGSYHSSIVDLVGQAAAYGKLSLVVRRYRNPMMSLTGVNLPDMEQPKYVLKNVRNVTITKKGSECFGFVIQSSLNDETFKIGQIVAGSPAGMNNDLLEDDTVLAVEGTPITGLQHPTVVNMIKKCDTSIELAVATPEIIDQTEFPDFEEQTELVEITLERDEKGFGFSIRGGKDFQQDTLFVLRIGKGGVADRNGLLRRGDEIVEINGQNMKEVCHQDAVDKIKSGGSMLSLIVKRRKLDIPPLIKHGLTDKPDTLKHPDRTHITSHDNELLSSLSNQGSTNLTLDLEGLVLADRDEIRPNNEYDEYELPNQEGELRENTIVDQRDEVVTPSLELEDRGMVVGSGD